MNTPNQPSGGPEYNTPASGPVSGDVDPLAGNPYSTQYRQAPNPDLDANAPVLRASDMQRMNRRALFFLAIIVLLLIVVAFWLFRSSSSSSAPKPKSQQDVITVPEAPKPVPPPAPVAPIQPTVTPIPVAPPPPPTEQAISQQKALQKPQGPSLLERRIENTDDSAGAPDANKEPENTNPSSRGPQIEGVSDDATSAQPLVNPDTLLTRGTYIRCVLETRIISDFPGFATCLVTEPVYSFTGHRLLLPKGSKVLGKYENHVIGNRIVVIWDRIITPTGISVNMSSPGIDQLGSSGSPGYLDSHWPSRIGAALLVSMLSDAFLYEGEKHGPKSTSVASGGVAVETPFQSNTAQTLQNLAQQAVQASANRPATITINQGSIVDIYVAKDVDFSGVVSKF